MTNKVTKEQVLTSLSEYQKRRDNDGYYGFVDGPILEDILESWLEMEHEIIFLNRKVELAVDLLKTAHHNKPGQL